MKNIHVARVDLKIKYVLENYDLGLGVGAINNKKIDISVSPAHCTLVGTNESERVLAI